MLFYAATIISLSAALWFVQLSLSYAQRETVVATSSQLISALADADVSTITVQQDIKLSAAGERPNIQELHQGNSRQTTSAHWLRPTRALARCHLP